MCMLIGAAHPCVFSEIRTGPWQAPSFLVPLCGGHGASLIPLAALHPQLSAPCGALLLGLLLRASWFEHLGSSIPVHLSAGIYAQQTEDANFSRQRDRDLLFPPGRGTCAR